MNKTPFALAISAAVFSNAVLAAPATTPTDPQALIDVYGKANVSLQNVEEKVAGDAVVDNWQIMSNASRLGFKGQQPLNDKLQAIYKLEYEVFIDDGDSGGQTFTQRNIYLGVQSADIGTFIAGRHDTPLKLAQGKVDRFNDLYYADIKYIFAGENRASNIFMYSSPKFSDINVTVALIPGEEAEDPNADTNSGLADGKSIAVSFDNKVVYAAVAIDKDVERTDVIRLVADWKITEDIKLGFLYETAEQSDNNISMGSTPKVIGNIEDFLDDNLGAANYGLVNEEHDGFMVSGEYTINQWVLKAQIGQSTVDSVITLDPASQAALGAASASNDVDFDLDQFTFGADYKFTKTIKAFAYYSEVTADADVKDSNFSEKAEATTFGAGLEVKF